jgi:hypothetical protein
MPEPCTLTRSKSVGRSHSRSTASTCAANASLSSIRSMSPASARRAPARARSPGPGRCPSCGRHAGDRPADQAREAAAARARRPLGVGDDAHGGAVVLAAGVARGHGRLGVACPITGRSPASARARCRARGCSSGRRRPRRLRSGRHRDDLLGEHAALAARRPPLVRAQRELVLLGAGMPYSRRRFSAVSSMPPGTG